jgi:hypothetical protein
MGEDARVKCRSRRLVRTGLLVAALLACFAGSTHAQTLVANDDGYGVPFGEPLLVEPLGVLENDTLDGGDPAGENGATAELVSDVSHGTLVLSSDGSFTYTPPGSASTVSTPSPTRRSSARSPARRR